MTIQVQNAKSRFARALCLIWMSIILPACGGSDAGAASVQGEAKLSALEVGPLPLSPAFSPDIHDYVVRCASGANVLSITMAAAADGRAGLMLPSVSEVATAQTVAVSVQEDAAVVVQATAPGRQTGEYWIRCLPHDFPALTVLAHPEAGQPTRGWYLIGSGVLPTGVAGFAMILDNNGTPVWYQRSGNGVYNVMPIADNTVAYFGDSKYQIRHLDTAQLESVQTAGVDTDLHDLQRLPNGNYLLMSYPLLDNIDLSGLSDFGAAQTVVDCVLQEIDTSGAAVWQWRASEHVNPVIETTYPMQYVREGRDVVDVYHCNSIDTDAQGNVLLSARHLDAALLISKQDGRVLWKLGGSAASTEGAPVFGIEGGSDAAFFRQHDARFLPGGGVSLFDNRTEMPGAARGVEYQLDFDRYVARVAAQYVGPLPSVAMGSFRHYEDGTRLVGWGLPQAGSDLVFSEFSASGQPIFEVALQTGCHSYRALKAPVSTYDLPTLRRVTSAK